MAEPVALIGPISNLVTFIDFGLKIAYGAKHIRNSSYSTTTEVNKLNRNLSEIIGEVQRCNYFVKELKLTDRKLPHNEKRIMEMVAECDKLAEDVRKLIQTLKLRAEARSKKIESVRVFTRSYKLCGLGCNDLAQ
ncbi:hypothetical protein NUW58_g2463 [Xylaria curta]|uniref:Uncharacterized protein n=1 Tax=Xylaria curta TaxID=42375 RepID=A0ACC1PFG6_9PEZI|nr:hypothetical protein NUW58_g2463 [Xylaria curta]